MKYLIAFLVFLIPLAIVWAASKMQSNFYPCGVAHVCAIGNKTHGHVWVTTSVLARGPEGFLYAVKFENRTNTLMRVSWPSLFDPRGEGYEGVEIIIKPNGETVARGTHEWPPARRVGRMKLWARDGRDWKLVGTWAVAGPVPDRKAGKPAPR